MYSSHFGDGQGSTGFLVTSVTRTMPSGAAPRLSERSPLQHPRRLLVLNVYCRGMALLREEMTGEGFRLAFPVLKPETFQ
jgi:hypothetical protein